MTQRGLDGRRRGWRAAPVRGLIFVVELYRHMVSPLRLPSCRFVPTCSQYAVDALSEYGLIRGGWLALARLLKCGPWHRGGWDPVPERAPGGMGCHANETWVSPAERRKSEHLVL